MQKMDESGSGYPVALPVDDVVAVVREWVELHARHLPDFAGAYLWGGITAMSGDRPFHLYRDVDVVVVFAHDVDDTTIEVLYRGVMLEVIHQSLDSHHDVEAVLASPSRAPNIATTQILADPTDILTPLQNAVVTEYRRRRWIQARCDREKATADEQIEAMHGVTDPRDGLWLMWTLLNALSGLLAVAQLDRPTTRRTLTLLGDLLDAQGRSDLREEALRLWGAAHLTRTEVQALLEESLVVFDRSVEVYQTPTPYGFTLQSYLRPYLADATQELIDEGHHREATFWIITIVTESYAVLQNDAPDAEKSHFAAQLQKLYETFGYTSMEAWRERVASAVRFTQQVYAIADTLVLQYSD